MAQYKAKLVRGNTYRHLASRTTFKKGVAVAISEQLKEHLEESAVDVVNDSKGERFVRPKFEFVALKSGNADEGDPGNDDADKDAKGDEKPLAPASRRRSPKVDVE